MKECTPTINGKDLDSANLRSKFNKITTSEFTENQASADDMPESSTNQH